MNRCKNVYLFQLLGISLFNQWESLRSILWVYICIIIKLPYPCLVGGSKLAIGLLCIWKKKTYSIVGLLHATACLCMPLHAPCCHCMSLHATCMPLHTSAHLCMLLHAPCTPPLPPSQSPKNMNNGQSWAPWSSLFIDTHVLLCSLWLPFLSSFL